MSYYDEKRRTLNLKGDINQFWEHFRYVQAEQFDCLKDRVIEEFTKIVDSNTAIHIYYSNAFSYVAERSSKKAVEDRTVTKREFINYLANQTSVMVTHWNLELLDKKTLLKNKRKHLSGLFSINSDVRAIVFSKKFITKNKDKLFVMIQQYVDKYFKKPKLQKQPIFIFDDEGTIAQEITLSLYNYQRSVNTGQIAGTFIEDSFINNSACPPNFVCKIANLSDITDEILERCGVNQVFWIGASPMKFKSNLFEKELIDIISIHNLKYLFGLENIMEDK